MDQSDKAGFRAEYYSRLAALLQPVTAHPRVAPVVQRAAAAIEPHRQMIHWLESCAAEAKANPAKAANLAIKATTERASATMTTATVAAKTAAAGAIRSAATRLGCEERADEAAERCAALRRYVDEAAARAAGATAAARTVSKRAVVAAKWAKRKAPRSRADAEALVAEAREQCVGVGRSAAARCRAQKARAQQRARAAATRCRAEATVYAKKFVSACHARTAAATGAVFTRGRALLPPSVAARVPETGTEVAAAVMRAAAAVRDEPKVAAASSAALGLLFRVAAAGVAVLPEQHVRSAVGQAQCGAARAAGSAQWALDATVGEARRDTAFGLAATVWMALGGALESRGYEKGVELVKGTRAICVEQIHPKSE